jgi:hypothetical protein
MPKAKKKPKVEKPVRDTGVGPTPQRAAKVGEPYEVPRDSGSGPTQVSETNKSLPSGLRLLERMHKKEKLAPDDPPHNDEMLRAGLRVHADYLKAQSPAGQVTSNWVKNSRVDNSDYSFSDRSAASLADNHKRYQDIKSLLGAPSSRRWRALRDMVFGNVTPTEFGMRFQNERGRAVKDAHGELKQALEALCVFYRDKSGNEK